MKTPATAASRASPCALCGDARVAGSSWQSLAHHWKRGMEGAQAEQEALPDARTLMRRQCNTDQRERL